LRLFALFILLFSCTTNASQVFSYTADTLDVFFLGVSLPIILFICWKLLRRVTRKTLPLESEPKITQEEFYSYTRDIATNLPTTQHALKQFERALKSTKKAKMAAVVFKPINFQQVNTVLGHHNSDLLLLQLAFCLEKSIENNQNLLRFDSKPEAVRLARLQGLDFLVIFDLSSTKHDAKSVLDNLCQQLAKSVPEAMSFKSFSLNFELAFGIAISGEHGNTVKEIVSHATDALLTGISNEQTIQYFDNSAILYTEQQLLLMEQLRQDIITEKLRWYLQPQINVDDNSIVGFELKVHWSSGDAEPLELPHFIELAEYSGDIYLLTKQMLTQAFKALFTLNKLGIKKRISVSLSSKNLLDPALVDFIEQQMKKYNVGGNYLMIEVSEQVILSSCQRAKDTIDQLKHLDVTISIANFSGSYESLRYLRKMAVHQVKINCQQLVTNENNRAEKAIINALITLARSMQLPLIGTHIDRHEIANSYTAMGGSLVQGDVIHNGFELDELEVWLNRWFTQHPEFKPPKY
jgi:EAL domain-containing protein (putative c-di-GMP-specific phosphodiesterase class I)/GGDEF domain-containing protein